LLGDIAVVCAVEGLTVRVKISVFVVEFQKIGRICSCAECDLRRLQSGVELRAFYFIVAKLHRGNRTRRRVSEILGITPIS
jgi:hypothetical protein